MLNLSPWLAAGAFAGGLLIGGGGAKFWYDRVVVPDAIAETVEKQEAICLQRVTERATAAKAVERRRQIEAGQSATSSFQQSIANAAEAAAVFARQFEEENNALARNLVEAGRSCPLDTDTLEWLHDNGATD